MYFPTDEQRILELLSKGYVIPISIYESKAVQNVLKGKFLLEKKSLKIIKQYEIYNNNVLSAKVDSRFNYDHNKIIFDQDT